MTLTHLLEIERKFLAADDERGLAFAERIWAEAGRPAESDQLYRALEIILSACEREGIRYPPILLRRRKEIQRGVWKPRRASPAVSRAVSSAGDAACRLCGGTGAIPNPGGLSGTLCECYFEQRKQRAGGTPATPA